MTYKGTLSTITLVFYWTQISASNRTFENVNYWFQGEKVSFTLIVMHMKMFIWWINDLSNFCKVRSLEPVTTNNYVLFRTLTVCSKFDDWWTDLIWKQSSQGRMGVLFAYFCLFVSISWLKFFLQRRSLFWLPKVHNTQRYVLSWYCILLPSWHLLCFILILSVSFFS